MKNLLLQFSFSFLATVSFSIIINIPKHYLLWSGFTGAFGWLVYWLCVSFSESKVFSALLASLGIAFISNLFSKKTKTPTMIFIIPGMFLLVPGGLAYQVVRNFVMGFYQEAISNMVQVVMISGAIALGVVLSEIFENSIGNN